MLSQEAISDLKKDYTFEQIQRISDSYDAVKNGNTLTHEEIKSFVDNELFSKYKINA